MVICGIDPGIHGAAFINAMSYFDLPYTGNVLEAHRLYHWLLDNPMPDKIFVEKPYFPIGQDNNTTALNYGRLLAAIEIADFNYEEVPANAWGKVIFAGYPKIDKTLSQYHRRKLIKQRSIKLASELYPEIDFTGKDGLAEAALLAEYGRQTMKGD